METKPVLRLATILSHPFEENTYVAHLEGRRECIVVDPGTEPDKVLEFLEEHDLTPVAILNTHGHADHIAGNGTLKLRWPKCPLVIGRDEASKLTDPMENLSGQFGLPIVSPKADVLVAEGDTYSAGGLDLAVQEIPGHSTGHVVFIWRGGQSPIVFGGDVLFAGSVGRTDFPNGDFDQLARGIHEKLFTLPDDAVVLSGHGPATTIGEEKRTNPFVGAPAGWKEP